MKTQDSGELPVGFAYYDNAVQGTEKVIEWLESKEWNDSLVGVSVGLPDKNMRNSHTQFVPMLSWTNPDFIHDMNRSVWKLFDEYAKSWDFSFHHIEDVSIQKYNSQQKYKPHVDYGPGSERIASAVLYLNTVEEGGETYFPQFDFGIKPVAGSVVLFPSNFVYVHEARSPKKGIKYAAAYWARG